MGRYKEITLAVQHGECAPVSLEPGITCRMDNYTTPTAIWTISRTITQRIATSYTEVQLGTAYLGIRREPGYITSDPSTYETMYFNAYVTRADRSRWLSEVINVPGEPVRCSSMYNLIDTVVWGNESSGLVCAGCNILRNYISRLNVGDYAAIFLDGERYVQSMPTPYYPDAEHNIALMGYGGSRPTINTFTIFGRTYTTYSCALRLGMTADHPVSYVEELIRQGNTFHFFPAGSFPSSLYPWIDRPRGMTISDLCTTAVDPYGANDVLPHAEASCMP
jgi:hypothetical protein